MADDKQATGDDKAGGESKAQAPASKPGLLPVVVATYVAVALLGVAVSERVLVPAAVRRSTQTVAKPAAAAPETAAAHGHGVEGEVANGGNVYLIEDLVVNPAGSAGLRYLAATVGLQSSQPTFLEDMKSRDAPVKDVLIRILGSKTTDQLADVGAREGMRAEIQQEVGRILPDQKVDAIYFTRFVLQ